MLDRPSPPPTNVAILRSLNLGDMLTAIPALRAFRRAWPDASITLLGLPWASWIVERFPRYLDRLEPVPPWPGLVPGATSPREIAAFLGRAADLELDLAVQLHGSGTVSNVLVSLLGAGRTAGHVVSGAFTPEPGTFVPHRDDVPERRRGLEVVAALGLPDAGEDLELPVFASDRDELGSLGVPGIRPGEYAVIHPGASTPSRRWHPDGFATVASALAAELPVVFTGTAAERSVVDRVRSRMDRASVDLSGRTSLGALAALVADAAVVVTNDTGTSHVADAVATPSVVIFTGSDPTVWAPLDRSLHPVFVGDPSPSDVMTATRSVLRRGGGHVPEV